MFGKIFFFIILTFCFLSSFSFANAGTLSCTVASSCASGTVVFKMYTTSNAHAELASQSTYPQFVCCSGVTGLSNNCSGTYATVAKLSGTTNAHVEQPGGGGSYAQSACLSVAAGGTVSVAYQSTNCSGYDTTIASMSAASTNAHVGDGSIYNNKICATASGAGSVAVDIVDSGGNPVATPLIPFSSSNFLWSAQQPTGELGDSSQKIRVTSTLANWSLTLAATSGPTALWQDGSKNYDFNGAASAGRLQVDANAGTITPQGGCATTGLSKGAATYFAQGTQDSISLLTGSSSQTGCYFDLTGVNLTQDLPASQQIGSYSIGMTLTAA